MSKSFVRFLSVKSKNFVTLLDSVKDRSKIKVVKIFHCETFEYAENLFERSDFWEFLVKSYNCFVIVIEIEENDRTGIDYMEKFNRSCNLVNRPLLIQFCHFLQSQ